MYVHQCDLWKLKKYHIVSYRIVSYRILRCGYFVSIRGHYGAKGRGYCILLQRLLLTQTKHQGELKMFIIKLGQEHKSTLKLSE